MKSLIIYCSVYRKNTEKVAKLFAEKIGCELVDIKNIGNVRISDFDLIGFGSGVYKESLSPKLFKLVEELEVKGKDVFVFSTSGVGMKFYNNKLIKLLASKGANIKGSFACKGSFDAREFSNKKIFQMMSKFSEGHPNGKDLSNAEKFIQRIL